MVKDFIKSKFFHDKFCFVQEKGFLWTLSSFCTKNTPVYNDNSAKRLQTRIKYTFCTMFVQNIVLVFGTRFTDNASVKRRDSR